MAIFVSRSEDASEERRWFVYPDSYSYLWP